MRFLIGLSQEGDPKVGHGYTMTRAEFESMIEARRLGALAYLGRRYTFGGSYTGTGYWEGKSEPCMTWEVIMPQTSDLDSHARETARELARMLKQECIGLVLQPVLFETVKP